jgi:hypothetical protein
MSLISQCLIERLGDTFLAGYSDSNLDPSSLSICSFIGLSYRVAHGFTGRFEFKLGIANVVHVCLFIHIICSVVFGRWNGSCVDITDYDFNSVHDADSGECNVRDLDSWLAVAYSVIERSSL